MPRACSSIAVAEVPHHCAAWMMAEAGTPAISAVHSGVYALVASRTSSKPLVCAAMNSRSIHPRSMQTWRMPFMSALSRPGRTGRNRSAVRAMGVMRGSMTMMRAPASRALQT